MVFFFLISLILLCWNSNWFSCKYICNLAFSIHVTNNNNTFPNICPAYFYHCMLLMKYIQKGLRRDNFRVISIYLSCNVVGIWRICSNMVFIFLFQHISKFEDITNEQSYFTFNYFLLILQMKLSKTVIFKDFYEMSMNITRKLLSSLAFRS